MYSVGCQRVDAQVANHFACVWKAGRLVTHAHGKEVPCGTQPSAFRFRHEWNLNDWARGATDAWLSTGILTDLVHNEVSRHGKCCATAGGVAAGLALRTCRRVTLFGLGGVGKGHVEDPVRTAEQLASHPVHDIASVHNVKGELAWIRHLSETNAANAKCL